MHRVEPKIFVIGQTDINEQPVIDMLEAVGMTREAAEKWWEENNPGWGEGCSPGELLIEIAGRLCYKSFAANLNANVTKIREGNKQYLANILKSKHGSVLEHSTVTVAFIGITRVFTHEVVRHRAGTGFAQESLRYVRLEDLGYRYPPMFEDDDFLTEVYDALPESYRAIQSCEEFVAHRKADTQAIFAEAFANAGYAYKQLCIGFEIDELKSFDLKKKLTSAFRRVAPIGLSTNIIVTANHRSWRHILELRTAPGAEEEMVDVIGMLADELRANFPNIYQDMDTNNRFENSKI